MKILILLIAIAIGLIMITIGYTRSKTWRDALRFSLVLILIVASAGLVFFIIGCWKIEYVNEIYRSQILPLPLMEYCLIGSVAISFSAWKKSRFKNLEKIEDRGFIFWLISGLIFGLIGEFR